MASAAHVKRAFRSLAKQLHPDKHCSAGGLEQEHAERRYKEIRNLHLSLTETPPDPHLIFT